MLQQNPVDCKTGTYNIAANWQLGYKDVTNRISKHICFKNTLYAK